MKSTISAKGQITVPVEVRAKLGLAPGTPVEFELISGGALLKKGRKDRHPVDEAFGVLKLRKPVDALLDDLRGPRPRKR